jgi:hypothetical protein
MRDYSYNRALTLLHNKRLALPYFVLSMRLALSIASSLLWNPCPTVGNLEDIKRRRQTNLNLGKAYNLQGSSQTSTDQTKALLMSINTQKFYIDSVL